MNTYVPLKHYIHLNHQFVSEIKYLNYVVDTRPTKAEGVVVCKAMCLNYPESIDRFDYLEYESKMKPLFPVTKLVEVMYEGQ